MPPVTVVIPTRDRPELMRAAAQSVVAQDYPGDIELIVVFDAGEVAPVELDLGPNRTLRTLTNSRTPGLAGARNTGTMAASHGLVASLDDDDTWMPGKLSAQVPLFAESDEVVLVASAMEVDDGQRRHVRLAPGDLVTHAELIANRIPALHSSSFVFRRDVLVGRLGMIDERLPGSYGEDYDVLLRTAQITPVRVVNEPLVSVRWTGQSYFYGRWETYAAALQHLLVTHPEFLANPPALGRIQSQIAFALAASGRHVESRPWARQALRVDRRDKRALLALAVSYRIAPPNWIARAANLFGRGI